MDHVNDVSHLEGYTICENPLLCDNIPYKDGNIFSKGESNLMVNECEEIKNDFSVPIVYSSLSVQIIEHTVENFITQRSEHEHEDVVPV